MLTFCKDAIRDITFQLITKEQVIVVCKDLQVRFATGKTIPGTRSFHFFCPMKTSTVSFKRTEDEEFAGEFTFAGQALIKVQQVKGDTWIWKMKKDNGAKAVYAVEADALNENPQYGLQVFFEKLLNFTSKSGVTSKVSRFASNVGFSEKLIFALKQCVDAVTDSAQLEVKTASWKDVSAFFDKEQILAIRTASKLTVKHINPTQFAKMQVKLATQLQQESTLMLH
eukprot:gene5719-10972_t